MESEISEVLFLVFIVGGKKGQLKTAVCAGIMHVST